MINKRIIDVANVIDSLHSTPKYLEDGYPMVRVVDVNNEFIKLHGCLKVDEETLNKHNKNHIPQKGDIIITRVGSYGMLGYVDSDKKFCLGQNIAIIHPHENSKFLYYYLQSPYMRAILFSKIGGSAYKCIGLDDIRKLPYNDSGLNTEKIGNFLYSLDEKIELNNKIGSELEKMVKTIYDYWFVQFDFPNEKGKPYKSSGGKMIWNEELKMDIPTRWAVNTLFENSLATILKPKIKKFEGEKEYLATANVNGKEITPGDKITYENRESRANMQPIENSIWFAKMKASKKHIFIGKYSNDVVENNILSTGFMGLKCEDFAFEYLASLVSSDIFELTKNEISHGATMQGIGNDDLKLIKLIVPNNEILINFKKRVESIYKKVDLIRQENIKLVELRDWFLPMLMNGQIKIN